MSEIRAKHLSPEELVEKYATVIYRIAYSRLQNVSDAEDITQEVLIKYIRAGKHFTDEDHRRMWLIRVTINAVNSLTRTAWRRHVVSLEDASELAYIPEEGLGIREAVEKLPEKYRIPIHLFYYEDLTIKQIAKATGNVEGTVKSLLSRGRQLLKQMMKEDDYVGEDEI